MNGVLTALTNVKLSLNFRSNTHKITPARIRFSVSVARESYSHKVRPYGYSSR